MLKAQIKLKTNIVEICNHFEFKNEPDRPLSSFEEGNFTD